MEAQVHAGTLKWCATSAKMINLWASYYIRDKFVVIIIKLSNKEVSTISVASRNPYNLCQNLEIQEL
jgi:hypothetical protein